VPADDQLLPPRGKAPVTFKAEPSKEKLLAEVLDDVRLDAYGTKPSAKTGIRFDCGRNRFVALLNVDIAEHDILVQLTRPVLIGLVTQQAPTDASCATRYLLLAWPDSDGRIRVSG
jgi:hypothetical protein